VGGDIHAIKESARHYPHPRCWRMLTYADVCWRMLTYAEYWRMLTYADACWRMLTHADVCPLAFMRRVI
jgi:hypothetical protein